MVAKLTERAEDHAGARSFSSPAIGRYCRLDHVACQRTAFNVFGEPAEHACSLHHAGLPPSPCCGRNLEESGRLLGKSEVTSKSCGGPSWFHNGVPRVFEHEGFVFSPCEASANRRCGVGHPSVASQELPNSLIARGLVWAPQ